MAEIRLPNHLADGARFPGNDRYHIGNKLNPPTGQLVFRDAEVSIAELIKQHRPEYRTAHFDKWHIGGDGPAAAGFDDCDGPTGNQEGNEKIPGDPKRTFGLSKQAATSMSGQVSLDRPFHLQISYYAAQDPAEFFRPDMERIRHDPCFVNRHMASKTDF